jgi:regulator of RNase E activity RraA
MVSRAFSNMGGISAQTGKRQGEAGAMVFGVIRDVSHSRSVNYPIWSTEVSPVTGKWRLETIEINGDVQVGHIRVSPGDIVVADDSGVCFIPIARAQEGWLLPWISTAKRQQKFARSKKERLWRIFPITRNGRNPQNVDSVHDGERQGLRYF